MARAMLKLQGIIKDYKVADTAVHALKGVSLAFRQKEFVAILGHSGCGKTTLLNIIGGLDHYTDGDLIIKGVSTKNFKDADWDAYRNHSIGFVFQSYNLIPHQTILGNVELALTLSGVSSQERKERAKKALERVGLGAHLNKKPNQLSGGQMQRVAIARALVNDPEILLADEPTGALDTETSVQIMDLIQEIAGERLVIMVTHNPELARQYATRIVELKDGEIVGDSMPLTDEECEEKADETDRVEIAETDRVETDDSECTADFSDGAESAAAADSDKKGKKRRKKKKTSMSMWTAFLLSGKNLLTKKGRTAVTSVAGSIGIISVCLVLALSNGFSGYIAKTEEDMLSYYPLEVNETALDVTAIMSGLNSSSDMPDLSKLEDKVYVNSFLTQIAQGMTVSNDISQNGYLDYVYGMDKSWYNAIVKDTGAKLSDNLFTTFRTGRGEDAEEKIMSLSALKAYYIDVLNQQEDKYSQLTYLVDYLGSVVSKMPGTSSFALENGSYSDFISSQYDMIAGDKFPSEANEAVLVVGGNNDMTDLLLAQLGYIDQDTFLGLFELGGGNTEGYDPSLDTEEGYLTYTFEELMKKPYTLYFNDSVYEKNDKYGVATLGTEYAFNYRGDRTDKGLSATENEGVEIKITAVLRLKEGLSYGCLSNGLNVTEKLVENYVEKNMQSAIVKWMNTEITGLADFKNGGKINMQDGSSYYMCPSDHIYTNYPSYYAKVSEKPEGMDDLIFSVVSKIYLTTQVGNKAVVRSLGGNDTPNNLYIYPHNFNAKDDITDYLGKWNKDAKAERDAYFAQHGSLDGYAGKTEVKYTDRVGLMMGMVQTTLDSVTYVLIAFTAISLVVSTVMIGVITYVSVVERTKEIGILRSIGARKKDIRRVFNAETFIIGFFAGILGVAVAYLLQVIINLILTPLTGIAGLAALPFTGALIMIAISVVLTLISGLLPASAAAKRDPVVALRSE